MLVIGASTGYGLASRIAAAFGSGLPPSVSSSEKPSSETKTGSRRLVQLRRLRQGRQEAGLYAKSINGDAFSPRGAVPR